MNLSDPFSAAGQFGLSAGQAGVSATATTGPIASPITGGTSPTGTGKAGASRLSPQHDLFYFGAMLGAGLLLFGYATERGVGVKASAHAGPVSAEAGAGVT